MPRESKAKRRERAGQILARLKGQYPRVETPLNWRTPFELLVATILSAQCTDAKVNEVTKDLFKRYRKPADLAAAQPADIEPHIRATGFFRNKAKSIVGAARAIQQEHGGEVPRTMDELTALPGVARKTANVVLQAAFGVNEGVVVDTHVARVSIRLKLTGWAKGEAVKIEQDLMSLWPRDDWGRAGFALTWHGRRVCTARKPDCPACRLRDLCPSADKAG